MNHCQEMDMKGVAPLKYHHTAVTALYLGGQVEEAIEGFKWQFGVGRQRGSYRTQQRAATHLSALHFDSARDDEAHHWLALAVGMGEAHPELANDFDLATLQLEYALVEGKLDAAQRVLDDITREGLPRNDVCQRWIRGAKLAIKSGRHELDAEARMIAHQIGQDRIVSMTGARDFEIAIAVEALLALGARRDASSIIDCVFRSKSITRFGSCRSVVSVDVDHRFRTKPITRFGRCRSVISADVDHHRHDAVVS
jgi:hypothetical protein